MIPHASAHANQNKDYVELVVSLPNIEQGGFNSGNNEVEDITNYVATSYSFKHSRLCLEILDEIIISWNSQKCPLHSWRGLHDRHHWIL